MFSLLGCIFGGFGTWCIGAEAYHCGVSGVIFTYFGYLVCIPCFERPLQLWSLVATLVVAFLYSTILLSVLPATGEDELVSWESHLCGVLVGIVFCWVYYTYFNGQDSPKYQAVPDGEAK